MLLKNLKTVGFSPKRRQATSLGIFRRNVPVLGRLFADPSHAKQLY